MKPSEFWKNWTKCTGSLRWRLATPDDLPAIRRLRNASQRLTGEPQRNPALFDMPVLLTLVAENQDGKIVDALYLEAQVELVKIGCSPDGLAEIAGLEEDLSIYLKSIGIRTVLATTLVTRKDKMADGLISLGFKSCEGFWRYFKRHL